MENKKYLIVKAVSETASFRIPEYHNFHKTLPLPPFTTLIGLAGAALGKEYRDAQEFFKVNEFSLGVSGRMFGRATDLWKAKSTKKKNTEGTVIRREFNYGNQYSLVFAGNKSTIELLANAFNYPEYPLSMGLSDSLLKVINVQVLDDKCLCDSNHLQHCILLGNFMDHISFDLDLDKKYVFTPITSPVSYNLPNAFIFFDDGSRKIKGRQEYTFIGNQVCFEKKMMCVDGCGEKIPIFEHSI
ncbi:MAG: CRISPR-associated protein Cas5 [Candidatus Omnitrophica bacterium]|nr:CRISPR-associated protein Cas5 [Candidatus Omnitrophota bacterium]